MELQLLREAVAARTEAWQGSSAGLVTNLHQRCYLEGSEGKCHPVPQVRAGLQQWHQ